MEQKELQKQLKKIFGFDDFRGQQEQVIRQTLEGGSSLILMPTGMGKSMCYLFPTKLLPGLTVVLSPLIALMKDQVDKALGWGFRCCAINSSLTKEQRTECYQNLAQGKYELIFVTPERFRKPEFVEALKQNTVSLLAIDEAHCISQWGHDFRPDFSNIGEFRSWMGNPVTQCLTATATSSVQKDILEQCQLNENEITVFNHGVKRDNLSIQVVEVCGDENKLQEIKNWCQKVEGSKIIYFSLISTLTRFSESLQKEKWPHVVYHGNLSNKIRKQNQKKFLSGDTSLILATPAFGLGVDKPDIRIVFHVELPGSIESYYQEIGRAGRDGHKAYCILAYDSDDISIQMDFIKWSNPDAGFIKQVYHLISTYPDRVMMEGLDYLREQLNYYNRRDFRLETALNLLEHWGCLQIDKNGFYRSLEKPDDQYLTQKGFIEKHKIQLKKLLELVNYVKSQDCRLMQIYRYFDVENSQPCLICDCCRLDQSH